MDSDYEQVLLVKQDVNIYKIPPKFFISSYRASDWNLDKPDWNGKLKLIVKGGKCILKILTKHNGELFAQCIINEFPGEEIKSVKDSSRFFVIKVVNELDGRSALLGIGFTDRGDSFDLNVALQDHFKRINNSLINEGLSHEEESKLKSIINSNEDSKIKINLPNLKSCKNKVKTNSSGTIGILPPPPSSLKSATKKSTNTLNKTSTSSLQECTKPSNVSELSNLSSSKSNTQNTNSENESKSNLDLLLEFDNLNLQFTSTSSRSETEERKGDTFENWGNFESYKSSQTSNNNNLNWENF